MRRLLSERFARVARRVLLPTILLAMMLGPLAACTTPVPATITQHPLTAIDGSAPIYVVARADRERILQSLRNAGLNPADRPSLDGYAIECRRTPGTGR